MKGLGTSVKMVTFVAGVRTSDWNRLKGRTPFIAIREYELGDLSHGEILRLIQKLKSENCLGELEGLSDSDCIARFKGPAKKNLLVALYEATKGKPFEDILIDEYETLISDEARAVYLTICMLNRLNVPVRAMLISRTVSYTHLTLPTKA